MAYGLKYTMRMMAKRSLGEILYNAEIYEKDYAGDSFEMVAGYHPFIMEGMAGTEDQYEPIIGTDFRLRWISNEFDPESFPDFVSTDDRKYHIKIYGVSGAYLVWQGFILNDTVKVRFNTGVTEIEFSCTDGLAMLKGIPYEPINPDINVPENLSRIFTNCLNKIGLPDGYDVFYGVNYYASGMDENDAMFKQAFYAPRNWLNSDMTYMPCYDVMDRILKGLGAKIQVFFGQFWITQPNELVELNSRFFQTNQDDDPVTVITRATSRVIKPYDQSDPTNTPFFFQDAIQEKILRKGFPSLLITCPMEYAKQGIDNGFCKELTSGFPRNWTNTSTGGGVLLYSAPAFYNGFNFDSSVGTASARPDSTASVFKDDTITVSLVVGKLGIDSPTIRMTLRIDALVGGTQYWLDPDNVWRTFASTYDFDGDDNSEYTNKSVTTPPAPVSGTIRLIFEAPGTIGVFGGNFKMTFGSPFSDRVISTGSDSYRKEMSVVFGAQAANDTINNFAQLGSITESSGNESLTGWYRLGVSESYDSIVRILAQLVYNMTSSASINFNLVLRGLYDTDDSTANHVKHIVGLLDTCYIQDSPDSVISVNGKKYIPAALTFDYTDDTVSGTMLEIKNDEVEAEFSDILTVK